jgi:uncharacterized protein YbaR (Trm112 family)
VIEKRLLEIIRCPQDHSELVGAEPKLVERINQGISAGTVVNAAGNRLEKRIDGGLVRSAGDLLYPIVDDIPVMLPDEAIELSQFQE